MNCNMYMIIGRDEYGRCKERERLIVDILGKKYNRESIYYYNCNDVNESIVASFKTLSFFVKKQVFIFFGVENAKKTSLDIFLNYSENENPDTFIILEGESLDKKNTILMRLKKRTKCIELKQKYISTLRRELNQRIKREKLKITTEAIELILERSGGSEEYMSKILRTLVLCKEFDDVIGVKDINNLIADNNYYDVYKLLDAVSAGKLDRAIKILNCLIKDGISILEIIGMMNWTFKRYLEAHILSKKGMSDFDIAKKLRIHRYYVEKFFNEYRSFKFNELQSILSNLLALDVSAKTTTLNIKQKLEILIIRICAKKLI